MSRFLFDHIDDIEELPEEEKNINQIEMEL